MTTASDRGPRIAAWVAAAALAVFSLGLLGAGGVLLWADGQKDAQGYLASDSERFATGTRALTTENLDLDLDGLDAVVGRDSYGKVRLEVDGAEGAATFVGIARTRDVDAYLRGVDHAEVADIDTAPFRADYRERPGTAAPAPPAEQGFWDARAQGTGTQTLTWDIRDGDWSVVVMNPDGSPGVRADVSAGAQLGFLDETGWVLLGMGAVALLGALAFAAFGVRPPRARAPKTFTPRPVASR